VLGHFFPDAAQAGKAFSDLGIDFLTALELRSRLAGVTGLRLPAPLVFDYPTAVKLAAHLRAQLVSGDMPGTALVMAEISRVESSLSALLPDSADGGQVMARLEDLMSRWGFRREWAPGAISDIDIGSAVRMGYSRSLRMGSGSLE
jgi:hypothetical protein